MEREHELHRKNVRLALILAAVALVILGMFIWSTAGGVR